MLVASVSTDRLLCCPPDLTNLLQMEDPSRWWTHHMVYIIPLQDKRSYARPSQDIPRQIYQISTYTEFYTPTRINIKSSLINLIILYFIRYFIPSASFCQVRAYRLGHFEFKPQTLFLLRSYYKNAYR
jgi:hypothetical protein